MPHLFTYSTHSSNVQVLKEDAVTSCRKKEERERRIAWERIFSSVWFIVLAILWSNIMAVCLS
jgi:hypothetical protein